MEENTNTNINENGQEGANGTNGANGAEGTETKTYTQEEVLKLLQSETDKRVSQALKTQQKKYEKQLSLSKLDGEERAKAEKDNEIAELKEKLAAFRAKLAADAEAGVAAGVQL